MRTTNNKWLPPQQEGFGPWIEWTGGDCPVAAEDETQVLLSMERRHETYRPECLAAGLYRWSRKNKARDVVAYCVKLEEQPAEPQQPAASGLTRIVALRKKALHTLEETTISDPQVAFWGISLDGVPMVRLDTLAGAQQVQRLADAAFQAGRQKAFSDLLGFVEGQR